MEISLGQTKVFLEMLEDVPRYSSSSSVQRMEALTSSWWFPATPKSSMMDTMVRFGNYSLRIFTASFLVMA